MARILVVDDTAFMRLRLNNLLTEAGHEVLEAENGQQAVERYAEAKPDLVLMDITMPVMDGLTALEQIRSQYPEARVIMCTAMGQQALVLRALKAGAKDFIVKPFEPQRVLTAVQRVLGGWGRTRRGAPSPGGTPGGRGRPGAGSGGRQRRDAAAPRAAHQPAPGRPPAPGGDRRDPGDGPPA